MSGDVVRMIHRPGRVVVAFRLSRSAHERLQGMVGSDTVLVGLRQSDGHERLVLAPPASPQLLGKLRQVFPDARIVVVELTDIDAGIRQGGPVTRSIDAGADSYAVVRSLDQLAEMVESAVGTPTGAGLPAALTAQAEDDLAVLLEELLARRESAQRARPEHEVPKEGTEEG